MSSEYRELELSKVKPNRLNPRLDLSIERLNELADSIKQVGLVEPIIVRPIDDEYEVVVGERRYRASQQAGLKTIPVIVRDFTDDEVIEINLIENVQREDLSDVEKGNSCKQLLDRYPTKYPTHKILAQRLGVHRVTVSSWIQAATLVPKSIQKMITPVDRRGMRIPKGKITSDIARQISRQIEEEDRQLEVAQTLAERPVPVRTAREIVRGVAREPERPVEDVIVEIMEAPYQMPFRLNHRKLILDESKIQTSRKGIDPKVKEGAIVYAAVWEPHFADLRILSKDRKKLGDFTEEDAEAEGGYTLEEFKEVWKSIHGEWNPSESVYVIKFEVAEWRGNRDELGT